MKNILLTITLVLLVPVARGENTLKVNTNVYVHLLCRSAITYINVGDPNSLQAEPLERYPHVLRIKALSDFEGSCSMSLVTGGRLYCFDVVVSEETLLNVDIQRFNGELVSFRESSTLLPDETDACMQRLLDQKTRKRLGHASRDKIDFSLDQIAVEKNLVFMRLTITNHSNTIYSANTPLFLMQDRKSRKAANQQEYALNPVRVSQDNLQVQAGHTLSWVMVFDAFTIPKHKTVRITLDEQSEHFTGRDLELEIDNKAISKAPRLGL